MLAKCPAEFWETVEEIRVRQDKPLELITSEGVWYFQQKNEQLQRTTHEAMIVFREDCHKLLNLVSNHSLYTLEEELQKGYITIAGGHRIGIAGKVVMNRGTVSHLRDITHFNIRLAHEIKGIGQPFIPYLYRNKCLQNILIVAPPQCGKTTLIRDLARIAATGNKQIPAWKVGIIDERSEIAGCVNGVPQLDVGLRSDVLDACPKAEGMMMMIRSMSPDLLIVDEIGRTEDVEAIYEAVYTGIHLIATVHGYSLADLQRRPTIAPLIQEKMFHYLIFLSRREGPGTIEKVYDNERKRQITSKEVPHLC